MNGLYYVGGQSRYLNYASQICALCIYGLVNGMGNGYTCGMENGEWRLENGDPCLEEMQVKARGTENKVSYLLFSSPALQ